MQFAPNLRWCISESNYIKLYIAATSASWQKTTKKHFKRHSTSDLVFLTLKILRESYYKQVMMVYCLSYEISLLFKVWIYDGILFKDYILLSQVSKSENS